MQRKQNYITGMLAVTCLVFLIFDSKTVLDGARTGIELVIKTVIPSLFPFMLTTAVLNQVLIGRQIPVLRRICSLCGIPTGAESIFLLGLIAGYPIGAKIIAEAYEAQQLDQNTARRLLGFSNNAGPAFIFGILSQFFTHSYTVFSIWGIHILSAFLVGILLPGKSSATCRISNNATNNFTDILERSIKTMATISGWIVIWRIIIAISCKYFLYRFPMYLQVIVSGFCELTNGCLVLQAIDTESARFIAASCLLSAGGLCIAMQTKSVAKKLGMGMYFPGKMLQTLISFSLSILISRALFSTKLPRTIYFAIPIAVLLMLLVIFLIKKKTVAIRENLLYN